MRRGYVGSEITVGRYSVLVTRIYRKLYVDNIRIIVDNIEREHM